MRNWEWRIGLRQAQPALKLTLTNPKQDKATPNESGILHFPSFIFSPHGKGELARPRT